MVEYESDTAKVVDDKAHRQRIETNTIYWYLQSNHFLDTTKYCSGGIMTPQVTFLFAQDCIQVLFVLIFHYSQTNTLGLTTHIAALPRYP